MIVQDILKASGFPQNPFRIVPPNDMENVLWAGDDSTIRMLLEAAQSPSYEALGTSELVVLFGEFGSGKTNALKFLTKELRTKNQLVAYLIKPSVADKPAWHDIVRSIFTHSFKRAEIVERLVPLRRYVLTESSRRAREELSNPDEDPDLLKKTVATNRTRICAELLPDNPGFIEFSIDLCSPDQQSIQSRNWKYLAEKPTAAEAHAIADTYGLPAEGMSSDYSATLLLVSLIRTITEPIPGGVPGSAVVAILMDELEGTIDLPLASRLSIQQGLKDLFNDCTEHLCIALAATASDASELWGILDQALMQRLSRPPIQVPHLGPEEAQAFLLDIMAKHRSPEFAGDKYFPFSPDGLDAFVNTCPQPLTPRKLLVSAQRMIFQTYGQKVLQGMGIDPSDVQDFPISAWGAAS